MSAEERLAAITGWIREGMRTYSREDLRDGLTYHQRAYYKGKAQAYEDMLNKLEGLV